MPRGVSWLHLLADTALLLLAFAAAWAVRFGSGWFAAPLGVIALSDWLTLAAISLPLWLLIMALHGLYYTRLKQSFAAELGSLTHAVAEALLGTILATFALRALPDSRLALLLAVAIAWTLLAGYRGAVRRSRRRRPRAVVIGTSPVAEYLTRQFAGRATRFDLGAAYATSGDFNAAGETGLAAIDAVFCDLDQAAELWQQLVTATGGAAARLSVHLLPTGAAAGLGALSTATIEGVPALSVKSAADLSVMRSIKRCVDIAGSVVALILTAPLWVFCVAGIALTMPGPLFFGHRRVGLFGGPFRLLKFRSMVRDADRIPVDLAEFDEKYKLENDPRVTPFGRLLRRMSLDELPQLVNILRGDLSLVGPRPIVEAEREKYGQWADLLTTVPPGLTGLWQVSGRSDTTYQQRIDFDLFYINNWSLGLDLLIILRTIPAVVSRRGAY